MEELENFVFAKVQYEVTEKQFILRVNDKVTSEALRKIKEKYEKDVNKEEANKVASMYLENMHKPMPPENKATWQPWKGGMDLILNDDSPKGLVPNQHVVLYAANSDGTYKFVCPELLSNAKYLATFVGLLKAMTEITREMEKYNQ